MIEDNNDFCNGSHHKMERFLEGCLLMLLYHDTGHGYGLMEQLSYFGFSEEQVNVSTLYRTLRKMEKAGSVVSTWEEGGQGPPKRVYHLTDSGKEELKHCAHILKTRKAMIEKWINKYEKTIQSIT